MATKGASDHYGNALGGVYEDMINGEQANIVTLAP